MAGNAASLLAEYGSLLSMEAVGSPAGKLRDG
jgi:hypothetical protein